MVRLEMLASKNVFSIYVGLIQSGYNLTDKRYQSLAQEIKRGLTCQDSLSSYFKKTVRDECKVNPYWPLGFVVTVLGLYLEEKSVDQVSRESILEVVSDLDQIDKRILDDQLIDWLKELPGVIEEIKSSEGFEDLWKKYLDLSHMKGYENLVTEVETVMREFIDDSMLDLNVIVIKNVLQAEELTDCVTFSGKPIIISSHPVKADIIHELLHKIFTDALLNAQSTVDQYKYLLNNVYDKMYDYQYAWDKSLDSWRRVFEENLMRAACLFLAYDDWHSRLVAYEEEGFIYTRPILEAFQSQWTKDIEIETFIHECLIGCDQFGGKL